MATPTRAGGDGFCPNCSERIADTEVTYEEAVYSDTQVSRVGDASYGMTPSRIGARVEQRSRRGIVRSGTVMLCSTCAAAYRRCVWLRATGSRLMNAGAVVVIVFALIYAVFLPGAAQRGTAGLIVGGLAGLGALAVLVGLAMYVSGRMMRRTAARFAGKPQAQ